MLNNRLLVPVEDLKFNEIKMKIYLLEPKNYGDIKYSIIRYGILEDLIVDPNTKIVISGNLRLKIAIELGMEKVPVIYRKYESNSIESISINTNQQRQKSFIEISNEIDFIYDLYPVGKGARSDKNATKRINKEMREKYLSEYTKDKIDKIKSIKKWCEELYDKDSWFDIYKKKLSSIDSGRYSLNSIYKSIQNEFKIKQNRLKFSVKSDLKRGNISIFNRSSETMPEVPSKFVDLVLTSPPYFELIDYSDYEQRISGDKGLGWGSVEIYMEFLVKTFEECKRVMKDNASLVVNINDSKKDGCFHMVPHLFVYEMSKIGFELVDEYLWLKLNPQYNMTNGSVRSHEYIFHFVKKGCRDFHFDDTWLQEDLDEFDIYKYGKSGKFPKLFSGFDPRLKVLKTKGATPSSFKKFCAENDLHFYNHGTFSEEIPLIFIKSLVDKSKSGVILDCYSGSSTTGKVANDLGHSYIGYEVNYDFILASELKIFGGFENKQLRNVA
jgi:DNA modification methylase